MLDLVRLLLALAGAGLLGYGAWLHYPPLGFAIVGLVLLLIAVFGALRAR